MTQNRLRDFSYLKSKGIKPPIQEMNMEKDGISQLINNSQSPGSQLRLSAQEFCLLKVDDYSHFFYFIC